MASLEERPILGLDHAPDLREPGLGVLLHTYME